MIAILYGLAIDTLEFVLAVFSGWVVLRHLDTSAGIDFQNVAQEMRHNGQIHIYLAARFLGISLLAASVYGS